MARGPQAVTTDLAIVLERALAPEPMLAAFRERVEAEKVRVITEQMSRSGGVAPSVNVVVDGQRDATMARLQPGSLVVLDWNYLREAVDAVLLYLQSHGPIKKGDWRQSVVALINGEEWDLEQPIPSDIQHAVVAVTVPYARRLEVGLTNSGRPFVVQVEQHFVEHVSMLLNQRLRDLAKFTFGYLDLAGAHQLTERWQHRRVFKNNRFSHFAATKRRRAGQVEAEVRYPAIFIEELQAI